MRILGGIAAFALAIGIPAAAPALERDDLELMRSSNMLDRRVMLHSDDWGVKPSESEEVVYQGQGRSLIDWDRLDPIDWLDWERWKRRREVIENEDDWRLRIRDLSRRETVGRVVQCLNECVLHTSGGSAPAAFGSEIKEGDEFSAKEDSYAWLLLADGTLARLSPRTSVSFFEINLAPGKVFLAARLNHGHAYFRQRRLGVFPKRDKAETDLAMYPLLVKEANRGYYAREEYDALTERQKLLYSLEDNPGHVSQYQALNAYLKRGGETFSRRDTELFVYTANAGVLAKNPILHLFHESGGETWIKAENAVPGLAAKDPRQQEATAYFRGYKNSRSEKLEFNLWHGMDFAGKVLTPRHPLPGFAMAEQFVKRVPAVSLAREILLRRHFNFMFKEWSPAFLARQNGYRLWSEKELVRRKDFLLEHTRRLETTNLRSIAKLFKERSRPEQKFGKRYYMAALKRVLEALKNSGSRKDQALRSAGETEFYLWMVKNAKPFLPAYLR